MRNIIISLFSVCFVCFMIHFAVGCVTELVKDDFVLKNRPVDVYYRMINPYDNEGRY